MKTVALLTLAVVGILQGCVGGGFTVAKWTPQQLAAVDDANLAFYYADAKNRGGKDCDAAKRLKSELQTRKFPEPWEWEHIERDEIIPGMTYASVSCVFGITEGHDYLSCHVTPDGVEEGYNYKIGFRSVGIWTCNGRVTTVIENGRVLSKDANTRRPDAPLVEAGK